MKKSSAKQKIVKSNLKISSFFTKLSNNDISKNVKKSNMSNEDADIIPATPLPVNKKKNKTVLNTISNRKRKVSNGDTKHKLDTFFTSPPIKKKYSNIENVNVIVGNELPTSSNTDISLTYIVTTPEKTKTTTKESPRNSLRSPEKTPKKSKITGKLFIKSPIGDFKVEVIENFVTVTPSKSSIKSDKTTPSRSSSMKQIKILNFLSPSISSRSAKSQSDNEKTPEKLPVQCSSLVTNTKAKINLSSIFSNTPTISNNDLEKDGHFQELSKMTEEFMNFDNSWDNCDIEEYLLDLSKSQRCKIINYIKDKNEVTIIVQKFTNCEKAKCKLEGFWMWCKLDVGCNIYLTAIKCDNIWKVTNEYGLLVYEPDILISNTAVVGTLFCKRRSILKEKFMGFEPENKVMVVGVLVHTLLQNVLKIKTANVQRIEHLLNELISRRSTVRLMYNCSLTFEDLKSELNQFVPRIVTFMEGYVLQNKATKYLENNWTGKIDTILDIEENIWCPELGVKGKVDISISSANNIMPVELKTGRATVSLEHRGQVMLYILMMSKLGYNVSSGLLLYLRDGTLREIPYSDKEKRDLILLRNELTYYLTRKVQKNSSDEISYSNKQLSWAEKTNALKSPDLPEPINHHSACEKCPYNIICCSYLKYDNNDISDNKVLNSIKNQGLSHLSDHHIEYFIHYSNLLDLEANEETGKSCMDIYTKTPEEREVLGKCIPFLKVAQEVIERDGFYEHTFRRTEEKTALNFLVCGIGESSYVVVSTNHRPAVAAGLVGFINHNSVTVALDRNLSLKFPNSIFHIDSYNSTSAFSFNFASLAMLLEPTDPAKRIRQLIIDKEPPTFKTKLPRIVATKAPPILKELNRYQQHAILKAIGANDYLLIKGMPGAGKTATIVGLIQILVELGQSILLTSHTHAAVDNVCIRLKKCGINFLRLGSHGRIHPEIKSMSESELTKDCKSPEELEQIYANAQVVAVTCLGTKHSIFNKRILDVCIVDESTQVIQCSLFRVISGSKKFILVGDPDQLPPVVRNKDATAYGLCESLFERLDSPDTRVTLNLNYRMNKTITALANSFMYKGELKIGNDKVENAVLQIPNFNNILEAYKDQEWITEALDQSLENAVKVIDTGPVWRRHMLNTIHGNTDRSFNVNTSEIAVILSLINALLKGGVTNTSIGVISPYTAQVAELSTLLQEKHIDISTVDQFQGRDKEVIIFSCTLSRNTEKSYTISQFHILENKRRLNVALTRAKHKFIIIGDMEYIKSFTPFKLLLQNIPECCFIRLKDGEKGFNWEDVQKEL